MSRLRVSLSRSPVDQEITQQVGVAERALQVALRACDVRGVVDPMTRRRTLAVRGDLERALNVINAVRRVKPLYDLSDPDLTDAPKKPRDKPRNKPDPAPSGEKVES